MYKEYLTKLGYSEEQIEKITSSLSPFEKDVYNLMINNFNYVEIGKILQKDSKSIDNCIQRLRKKIKDLVDTTQNML